MTEIIIVELLLKAIAANQLSGMAIHLHRLQRIALAMKSGDPEAVSQLRALLIEYSELKEGAIESLADMTLGFVRSEVERYTEISKIRELTSVEKDYGQNTLGRLLTTLNDLIQAEEEEKGSASNSR